jgi:deoxyribodipyrimidine photo-lyase
MRTKYRIMMEKRISIFWFRRDLRLEDNTALSEALTRGFPVLPIFIFDDEILSELEEDDARVGFIHELLEGINAKLQKKGSSLKVFRGQPLEVWKRILETWTVEGVYVNRDYEPYAIRRDKAVEDLLKENGISLKSFKDQVVFEGGEILKNDGSPYHVFTPYKNKWLARFREVGFGRNVEAPPSGGQGPKGNFYPGDFDFPTLESLGFRPSEIRVRPFDLSCADRYEEQRNFPWLEGTSRLGPHLRFGSVSIRDIIEKLGPSNDVFLSELIWREFFMQILFHYPRVVHENFNPKYNGVVWRNDKSEFDRWCQGNTGYPLVDAGMRELNETGFMHNRVRMITAGFLCKHLLIDWRWGESYFAGKLLDYELSSNNGNWQWSAGTGCDAAPYFRIFNPVEQLKKFDNKLIYVRKWVPELDTFSYPEPMVDHKMARQRALETYKAGMGS